MADKRRLVVALVVGLCVGVVTSCGGGGSDSAKSSSPTTSSESSSSSSDDSFTTDESSDSSSSLPPGAEAGIFDFNDDGSNEPTCGTADFQAGLVVSTYCEDLSGYLNDPEAGATLVPGALLSIPGPADDPRDQPITEGASVVVTHLQNAQSEIVVLTLSSDTVFAVGSDALQDPALDSLAKIAAGIASSYPNAAVEVRGHTDSTGNASDNQSLSERRAAAVADYFSTQGLDKSKLSSVGLGQTVPNYLETNPDGSENEIGRNQNRRIEVVIRPA